MPSYEAVEKKLKEIKGYMDLFKNAFPGEANPITVDNFAKAIGALRVTFLKSLAGKIPEDALKVPLLPSTE